MKKHRVLLSFLLTIGLAAGCEKEQDLLNQVNPNAPTASTFWKTETDAIQGLNAAYSGIQNRQISLWEVFHYDMRSDEGYSQSPWTELANVGKFIFTDYNIVFTREMWHESYRSIYRCNQVLAYLPNITMDENLKKRMMAEAKFLRGHLYFKLVTLFGRVPLVTTIQTKDDRPEQATIEQGWAQVVQDFTEAKADLPDSYNGNDIGRATKGAATAYLGKAYLQQKKWSEAAAQFKLIVDQAPGRYDLMPNFRDNFTDELENNKESIFEIQFTNNNGKSSGFPVYDAAGGDETSERAQFFGIRGMGWCDGQPTKWLLDQFMKEKDKDGNTDPRLQYTIFYNGPGQTMYGKTFQELDRQFDLKLTDNDRFWKKYTNYYKSGDSYFSGINTRVIRLADVYLMYAECLNELNRTAEAIPFANLVRKRSNMNELSLAMSQTEFREQLRHDRVVELAGESVRFLDMMRYGILAQTKAQADQIAGNTPANVAGVDTEFKTYAPGKEYLPIPLYEIDANAKVTQNASW